MPYKPKKPCGYPGCPKLTNSTYCNEHQKIVNHNYNKYSRNKEYTEFYKSTIWKMVRKR